MAISPVVTNLVFMLAFNERDPVCPLLDRLKVGIVFTIPKVVLTAIFMAFPFVSERLVPILRSRNASRRRTTTLVNTGNAAVFEGVAFPRVG